MAILHIDKNEFESKIKTSDKVVLLDFYADWCGPCKMIAPIVEEIANEKDDIIVAKVNVDECPELAIDFKVASIPTLIVLKDGVSISKAIGYRSKEQILELLNV